MKSAAPLRVYTIRECELDPGAIEFAIGRIETRSSAVLQNVLATHRHDFYEIMWLVQGQGKVWIDLDSYPVEPNMMCFLSPGQIHAWTIDGNLAGFLLVFTDRFFADNPNEASTLTQLPYFRGVRGSPVLHASPDQAGLFTEICERMERELRLGLYAQAAALRAYMTIILIEARRIHDAQRGSIRTEETAFLLTIPSPKRVKVTGLS